MHFSDRLKQETKQTQMSLISSRFYFIRENRKQNVTFILLMLINAKKESISTVDCVGGLNFQIRIAKDFILTWR